MIELRFHKELYDGFAVDEAAKVFADFVACTLREEPHGWVVAVGPKDGEAAADAAEAAAELANYALGKTIERRGAEGGAA